MRGEKRRLAELAAENAQLALAHETTAAEQKRLRRIEALESLRESLNLESLPLRIECFDISNLQGRDIVASMTVFVDAQPKKAHYRSFTVRGLDGQDDFASMAQVIARRFARLRDSADAGRYDESFAAVPNLVVIDGGKGQLAAALEAIQATYELPRVAVIALAKREEEVFVPGRSQPILLDRHDPGLQLLAAHPRRGPPVRDHASTARSATRARSHRSSTRSRASARRAGARSCTTSARPTGSSPPRRRSSRPFRACRRRRPARCSGSSTAPAGRCRSALSGGPAPLRQPVAVGAPEAERAQGEQDRGEADDDVDDRERQLHADAEGEQGRARRLAARGCRARNACSVPTPARADRNERREALRRLHEQHVAQRSARSERAEQEPDRRQAERPVGELPRRRRCGASARACGRP